MEKYEITYLIAPDDKTNTVEGAIKELKGFIANIKDFGVKELAYPVNKLTKCRYISVIFTLASENLEELENKISKDKSIVRHILIKALRAKKPAKPRDPSKAKSKIEAKPKTESKPVEKAESAKTVKAKIEKPAKKAKAPVKSTKKEKPAPKKSAKKTKVESAPSVEELDKKLKELVKD